MRVQASFKVLREAPQSTACRGPLPHPQDLNSGSGASALQGMTYTAAPRARLRSDLPLTMEVLSSAPAELAQQMIGERLFPLVSQVQVGVAMQACAGDVRCMHVAALLA